MSREPNLTDLGSVLLERLGLMRRPRCQIIDMKSAKQFLENRAWLQIWKLSTQPEKTEGDET